MTDTRGGLSRGTVAFPDLRRGNVAIMFVTVIARVNPKGKANIDFKTHEIAYAHAQGQFAYYRELQRQGVLTLITNAAQLDAHLAAWEADGEERPLGAVLTMEGADPVVDPLQVHLWQQDGFRVISLAHYGPSKLCGRIGQAPVRSPMTGGLCSRKWKKPGIILDVTHLCDESFAPRRWRASPVRCWPPIRTAALCAGRPPVDRRPIEAIVSRGGVIGARSMPG